MFNRRYATLAVAGLVFATGMAVAVATMGSAHAAPSAPVTVVTVGQVESGEPTAPTPVVTVTAAPKAHRTVTVHHTAKAVRAMADPEVSTVTNEPTNEPTVADDSPGLSAVGDAPPAQPAPSPKVEGAPCVSFLGNPGTLAADLRTCIQNDAS